jgi:riboflavin synthase
MFTGIVEELGVLESRSGGRLRIGAEVVLQDARIGDSIAVNGCCLTVVEMGDGWWEADLSDETLSRTSFGGQHPGAPLNLERAMRLSDRVGGHIVQGHVDAVGTIVAPVPALEVSLPSHLLRYLVEKGSITVDGVSLTVAGLVEGGFTAAIIPHTAAVTTLGSRRPGDTVNIEVDLMAKQLERLLGPYRKGSTDTP